MYTIRLFNSRHAVLCILFLYQTFGAGFAQEEADKETIEAIKRLILDGLGMKSEPVIDEHTIERSVKDHVKRHSKVEHTVSKVSITPTKTGKSIFEFDVGGTGIYGNDPVYFAVLNIKLTAGITKNKIFKISQDGKVISKPSLSEKEWISEDITRNLVNWIKHKSDNLTKAYVLDIKREIGKKVPLSIYLDVEYRKQISRRKRMVECSMGQTTCCRKSIHLKVKDFNWDKWFFAPKEFNFFYCDGSCENQKKSKYGGLLSGHIKNYKSTGCCIPTKLHGLRVMHVDERKGIFEREIPDIMAESCGCSGT
ncbi:growth/differentiation factor 8-like [Hydractinia symbiolongicarpus]|uniref:growth/differentiation factor 8-like n=1 Tax=Hydractinia symbiolongicarpus TaxID=13093 RepID=UPI00254F569A|nr:growth/differentiation factor 8-like [Hydractinia symbiolongicarpus]